MNIAGTPLHYAAMDNATETAQLLLTQGVEVNAKTDQSATPLHYAAWKNATETAQLLIMQGADVNEKDKYSRDTATLGGGGQRNRNSPTLTDPRSQDKRQKRPRPRHRYTGRRGKNAAETTEVLLTQGANVKRKGPRWPDTTTRCGEGQCN